MKTLETIQAKRSEITRLARRYHAVNIRIFGSVARGDDTDSSDIDFLVSFLPGASLFDQAGLIEDLSDLLQRKVDVISERAVNPLLHDRINKEAKPL